MKALAVAGVLLALVLLSASPTSASKLGDAPAPINPRLVSQTSVNYVSHAPIVIANDSGFNATNGVTGGSGTSTDPFVISGWDIDSSTTFVGIQIQGTTAFWVVRNVQIHSTNGFAKGVLTSSPNGVIENSTFLGNGEAVNQYGAQSLVIQGNAVVSNSTGFFTGGGTNVTIRNNDVRSQDPNSGWSQGVYAWNAHNVTVTGNRFNHARVYFRCTDDGIVEDNLNVNRSDIWMSSARRIHIFHNTLLNSFGLDDVNYDEHGTGCTWPAGNNTWDDGYPSGGNFWSSYPGMDLCTGPAQNVCTGGDGIGDTPMTIWTFDPSLPGNFSDRFPLMSPYRPVPIMFHTLYGSALAGWGHTPTNQTSPGPILLAYLDVPVNLTLYGVNGNLYNWFLDYNGNQIPDAGEPLSPNFTYGAQWFEFTPTTAGNFTYECGFYPTVMRGTMEILPAFVPRPTLPSASFTVTPSRGNRTTLFVVDASASSSGNASDPSLEYRWDWEGDGTWDTPWSVNQTAEHSYGSPGNFTLVLQVRTPTGLAGVMGRVVTVDDLAPVTTASLAGTSGTNDWFVSTVTVSLATTDDASGVASTSYRLDGGSWQTYAGPFTVSTDGVHILEAYSVDLVGNVESVRTWSISIDSVPPQMAAQRSGMRGLADWYISSVLVTLSASDSTSGVSSISSRIDGGPWQPATSPFSVQGDGVHHLEFRSTDMAGNVGPIVILELPIDVTPPTTTPDLVGIEGSGGWFTSNVVVALRATDSASGVGVILYRLDGGSVSNYVNPLSLSDGVHVIDYRSVDAAGNEEAVKSITIPVDRTGPAIVINPTSDIVSDSRVTIAWNATDALSGVTGFEVSLDGGPSDSVGMAKEHVFLLVDGEHTVTVSAIDAAGNSAQKSVRFRTDTNVFSLSGPYHGAPTIGGIIGLVAVGVLLFRKLRPRKPSRLEDMTPIAPETINER